MRTSLYETLLEERAALRREETAIHANIDAAEDPKAVFASNKDRLGTIDERLTELDTDISVMDRSRARERDSGATLRPDNVDLEAAATGFAAQPGAAPKPFATFGDQLAAIRASAIAAKKGGEPDKRLLAIEEYGLKRYAAASGMNESVGSDGGFLLQEDYSTALLDRVAEAGVLAPRCTPIELSANSNHIKLPLVDETSRATGSRFGGVQVYWEAEAATATAKKPKFAKTEFTLRKLLGFAYDTGELMEDSQAGGQVLEAAFSSEMAFSLDDAIVRGTGAGIPRGFLNGNSLVSVAKETGQTAATILAENVQKMFARIPGRSLGKAEWYINQDCWPQIFALHQVIGTGGVPLFIPAGGINSAPNGTLLGRPINVIEQASTLGTQGDISLVDLSQYLLIRKGGIARASSIHVAFLTDEEVFRWILRIDGGPAWLAAVTPYKGSATVSPFVTLDTRS